MSKSEMVKEILEWAVTHLIELSDDDVNDLWQYNLSADFMRSVQEGNLLDQLKEDLNAMPKDELALELFKLSSEVPEGLINEILKDTAEKFRQNQE